MRSRWLILRWVVGTIAVVLGLLWFIEGAARIRMQWTQFPWDFNVDWRLARAYVDGYNPYTPEGAHRAGLDHGPSELGHPPSTAFWALPLVALDVKVASGVLGLLCLSLLAFQVVTMTRELACPNPLPVAWLGFSFVMSCEFFAYHLVVGQISEVIGFCFFLTWLAIRHDDEWLAGIALGVACSLKPFPGVVVLLLLILKRYRAVASAIAIYAGVSLVMTVRFGWKSWPLFLEKQKAVADMWLDSVQNLSLHGIVIHLFRHTCKPHGPVIPAAALISSILSVCLVGGASWIAYRMPKTRADAELLLGAFIPLAMFASQWAWEHYNVILVVPFAIATDRLARKCNEGALRGWIGLGVICLAVVLYAARMPVGIKQSLQDAVRRGDQAQHFRLHVYEALNSAPLVLLLILMTVLVLIRLRRRSTEEGTLSA